MQPFPLQQNLKRLKPNLGRAAASILFSITILFEPIRDNVGRFATDPKIWILAGLIGLVILYYLADMYIKEIYFCENGIGIARRFGGEKRWYSFDELRDTNQKSRAPLKLAKTSLGSSTLRLQFHSGKLTIWSSLYDKKDAELLINIVQRRAMRLQMGGEPVVQKKTKLAKGAPVPPPNIVPPYSAKEAKKMQQWTAPKRQKPVFPNKKRRKANSTASFGS